MEFKLKKASNDSFEEITEIENAAQLVQLAVDWGEDLILCFEEIDYKRVSKAEQDAHFQKHGYLGPHVRAVGRKRLAQPTITIYDGYVE